MEICGLDRSWNSNTDLLIKTLEGLEVTGKSGSGMPVDEAFATLKTITETIKRASKTIFFIGNGASASMASHISADLEKNFHVHTEVFTDLALITAIANDMGYEEVFAEPIRRKVSYGDVLVAISSSGRSPNILKAIGEAAQRGIDVITVSAMNRDNPLRRSGDVNFYVPATTYGVAETCHAAILHYWVDLMTGAIEAM